jgi:shikimate dehydrogenase
MGRTSQSVLNLVDLVRSYGLNAHVANLDASALASSDLVVSTVPGSALADLWEEVSTITIGEHATLFDVAYEPWPSLASKAWGPKCISGLELLIWQGIEQVKLFANSQNYLVKATDSELYGVMKASVAE